MDKIQGEKFRQFIEDNRSGVCRRIVQRFKLSADDAQDIYQESAIALYKGLNSSLDISIDKYFAGIWYRQALKFMRRQNRTVNCDMGSPASDACKPAGISLRKLNEIVRTIPDNRIGPQLSAQPDELFDLNSMKERVVEALGQMARQCRQLLTKYYIEGYDWTELARHFDLKNANTAKAAANRCRRRFEEKYKELEVYLKEGL